jgi:hypothetical protein
MAGNRPPDGEAKRTKRTLKKGSLPKWAKAFLEALKASGNVTYACAHAGVGRRTVYERREANEDFQRLWDEAIEDATDAMLLEARRRATQGVKRKKFYKGEAILDPQTGQPYIELEYSDALLMFLIKAHRPEYRDSFKHEHTGADGGPIQFIEVAAEAPTSPAPEVPK